MARQNRTQIAGTDFAIIAQNLGLTASVKTGETKYFRPGSTKVCVAVPNTQMVTRVYLVNWTWPEGTMAFEGRVPAKTVEQELLWAGDRKEILQRFYRLCAEGLLGAKLVASPAPVRQPSKEELIAEFEAAYNEEPEALVGVA